MITGGKKTTWVQLSDTEIEVTRVTGQKIKMTLKGNELILRGKVYLIKSK